MIKRTDTRILGVSSTVFGAALMLTATPALLASSESDDSIEIIGVIRDFIPGHPAFRSDVSLDHHDLHIANLVGPTLDDELNPLFSGAGRIVDSPATDALGNAIPPQLAAQGEPLENFDIVGGHLVPKEQFAARLTFLGAAIQSSSYHLPVTTQIRVGDQVWEPFGPYTNPVDGNVNDDQSVTGNRNTLESRVFDLPGMFPAGTTVTVDGQSWERTSGTGLAESDWSVNRSASSLDESYQVRVLRDGDPVPNISGAFSQASVGEYVSDFVSPDGQTMSLKSNEVIWLFELGTDASSSSADFQDLVMLVTLATSTSAFDGPRTKCGEYIADSPAGLGAESQGGIDASSDVGTWFTTIPTVNASANHTLSLASNGAGMFEYATPDFTPIDDGLFGKQGANHNRSFTYEIHAKFDYEPCSGQVFEFAGAGDVWVFIDGAQVMDLGGSGIKSQRLELDRLDLSPDETHRLSFFYVNRRAHSSPFGIRTNLRLWVSPAHLPPSLLLRD